MPRDIVDLTGEIADRLINRADVLMDDLHHVVRDLAALLSDQHSTEGTQDG